MKRTSIFLLLFLLIAACKTSPTGRKQLILLKDAEMNQLGEEAFQDLKSKVPIETSDSINRYVKCIVLAELAFTDDDTGVSSWEVVVFRDSSPNAFALPGGKIGVHTGILPIAKTPGQLAAVLGHEIGHVIARHGNERVSQNQVTQGAWRRSERLEKKKWRVYSVEERSMEFSFPFRERTNQRLI